MSNSVLNVDFLYIAAYFFSINVTTINPYVIFFGGIIAIIVGIANLIKFYSSWQDRKYEHKKEQND